MKELEKTKRISIASVLFILIVLIALLAYKRPKHLYSENTKSTLEKISTNEYFVSLSDINFPDNVLIDIRNKYEFEKGHLENAINIYAPEILSDKNSEIFEKLNEDSKTIILYGNSPGEVVTPFMILHQLGVANIKILSSEISYLENNLNSKEVEVETYQNDVTAYIQESIKKAAIVEKPKPVVVKTPKKIIPIKKKKKMPVEGGC
jgi:rhodanese-related sulfurtransferase